MTLRSRCLVVVASLALVSGMVALPGVLRGFPASVEGLAALKGWSIQEDRSFHRDGWERTRREWVARKESLKCRITVTRFGIFTKPTYGSIMSSMYSQSRKIPPFGASSYQLFSRANVVCRIDIERVEDKVDWMSWPHPRLVEQPVSMPELALPIAKALDQQVMLAVYSQRLFLVSLLGMLAIEIARMIRKRKRRVKRSDPWRNRWE